MINKTILDRKKKKAYQYLISNDILNAKQKYKELLKYNSNDSEALYYLSVISMKDGEYITAKKYIDKALLMHKTSGSYTQKGKIEYYCGYIEDSIKSFIQAIKLDSRNYEPHYCLGNIYREINNLEAAEESYKSSLSLNKQNIFTLTNLGALLHTLGRDIEAREYLEQAYRKDSTNIYILCNLAEIELFYDRFDLALKYANKAASIDSNFFDSKYTLGRIYKAIGDYEKSLSNYNDALIIDPLHTDLIGSIAEIYEIRNELNEAEKLIKPFIESGKATPLIHRVNSSILRNNGKLDLAIKELTNIDNTRINISEKIDIGFELGKLYDKKEKYKQAFESYKQSNEIIMGMRGNIGNTSDTNDIQKLHDKLKYYNYDYWNSIAKSEMVDVEPIFIIGMPRSGTTLTEHILASHSKIFGAGELPTISEITRSLSKRYNISYPEYLDKVSTSEFNNMARVYADVTTKKSKGEVHVVDKMPTNFRYVGLILSLFPRSKIIHIKRNPFDTSLSIYFQHFSIVSVPYSCDLGDILDYYSSYQLLMNYWNNIFDKRIYNIKYESLIREPEKSIKNILEYCGLEFESACLSHSKTKRDINTPSYYQVRQPLYDKSINRWEKYKPYIEEYLKTYSCLVDENTI